MDLEQRVKELEQKVALLEQRLKDHDGELVVISNFMNYPGKDGYPSVRDLIEEAKKRGWFK